MTLRSPVHAMLWELWRLTRVEAAWRLAVGIVGGLAVLVAFAGTAPEGAAVREAVKNTGAIFALVLLVMPQFVGWISIAKRTIGRPGFPFALLYSRPVPTAAIVGVPMAYLSTMPAALYLVSAFTLRATSGYAFPLVPVAAWIAALTLVQAAINWSTRNWIVTLLGNIVASGAWFALAAHRMRVEEIPGFDLAPPSRWPTTFDFPLTDYALIAAMGLASFGVAVAGVARQRRGDAVVPWTPVSGFPESLVNLFRFPCPTTSPTRAQVWFDLKSSGLPVLTIGLVLAMVNPLVFAVSVPIASVRPPAIMCAMFSVLTVLLLGGNAFALRWRPGHAYTSAFEATRAAGSAQLAGLKVLVRTVCMLVALVAVGGSLWASLAFIAVGKGYEPLRSWQHAIEGAVGTLTGYQQVTLAFVASVAVAVMVASLASFRALVARYHGRRGEDRRTRFFVGLAGWLVLLHGLVLATLVMTGYRGVGSVALWEFLLHTLVWVTRWIDAPAIVLATVYVSWKALSERLLTLRNACGAVLVSAAFAAAWVTMLRAAGVSLAGMSATDAVWMLSPGLLPLMASVLAPWSLDRIRHT